MTDTHGQGAPATPPSNVSALVEAIDARARQAGSEGAATLLRGTLASVSEVLSAIQDRLDHLEEALAERHEPTSVTEQVQAGLNSLNARLGRLEEAFVRAVEDSGSGTEAVVDQLRQTVVAALREAPARGSSGLDAGLRDALDATSGALVRIEAALDELNADQGTSAQPPVIPELEVLAQRLEGVEGRLADQSELTRQMIDRMGEAHSAEVQGLRLSVDALSDSITKATTTEGPLAAQLADRVTEAVRREAEAITQRVAALKDATQDSGIDAGLRHALDATSAALVRIEAALDELNADQGTSAQPPVIPELEVLAQRLEGVEGRLADQSELTRQMIERMGEAYSAEVQGLRLSVDALSDSLAKAATPHPDPPGASAAQLADQVTEAVRREAELITQRVAALAVGVEASRAMLEQHVEETENSLGRKATEVTRRLASDLGLRARRGQHGGPRRDPRQLGPGS